ncbi:LacI family DNA-binding transcriptional regulator [Arthrobacter sp. B2a2-09]|uniref:LacI family DNA-binding transcriptional regulator n=1 Tax=Arthrobacter sp. B2a2-09 TaxID=2952822 RepID=UPI0022CD567F|nr:LacI family DNA-binding transcriptional regulator [Arthrobacter sp. B2a2-09]MCZ9882285.1 LacI family transcriptional regulator [Arthrobacter sp. B2a2-09]
MAQGSVTIIDLAAGLGLSKTTVADALKGSGRVSESTRRRVQQAAQEMRYVSNRAARQLRTNSTEALALYIPPHVRNMSFYMPFAFGVADGASRYNYDLTLIAQRAGSTASWSQVDGVIIIDAVADDPVVKSLIDLNVPIVTAGHIAGFPEDRVAGIIEIEHKRMCAAVLDELKSRGASRPAFIAPTPGAADSWSEQVRDGYLSWCAANGVPVNMVTIPVIPTNEELEAALASVLSDVETDAILFGWHDVANRGELQLERMGHRVGKSILLGALASSEENLHSAYLTVLDLRPREFGDAAVELLHEVIQNPPSGTIHRLHEVKIVADRSVKNQPGSA